MSTIEFKLDAFEGPLDLLLFLVNRHKLNIYDIEISLLLEQYLEYIDGLEQEDFDQAGDFLAMAARLVYIKTCSLLPRAEEAEELKKELEGELIEYSVCKEAAMRLKESCVYGDVFVRPPEKLPVNKVFTGTMDPQLLVKAYLGMSAKARSMKPVRAEQFKQIVSSRIVTVTSKIVHVLKMLYTSGKCTVAELYEGVEDRSARVATFLAVLELTKSGRIMLNEDNTEITFNRDAPRRRREHSETEPEAKPLQQAEEEQPAVQPAQPALNTEPEKPEPLPAPAAEHTEEEQSAVQPAQPALNTEPEKPEPLPAQAVERTDEQKNEVQPLQQAEEVKPEPQPEQHAALDINDDNDESYVQPPRRTSERTVAAGKYSGAVKAAAGATMALPVFAPLLISAGDPPADESPAEQPPVEETPAEDIPAVNAAAPLVKINRFARRYFWGYPSAGNCFRYRRERL